MVIRNFAELEERYTGRASLRPAIAGADDPDVMEMVIAAIRDGLVAGAMLTGKAAAINALVPAHLASQFHVVDANTPAEAAARAVFSVREGHADVLVKGQVDSTSYLRAVLSRDTGLSVRGVLSNITLAEMPSVPRFVGATDNGIIPLPTLEQKRGLIRNAIPLFEGLGVSPLRIAAIAATEKVSAHLPSTTDAAILAEDSRAGAFGSALVDGPFGYDVALSLAAARTKGLAASPVAGQADLILFSSIEAGNATVKSWKLHGQARTASIVMGADIPILLNSRSDGADQRRLGLLLAAAVLESRAM